MTALALITTLTWPARAGDSVAAEALFKQGLALLEQEKWSEACPTFQASFDLDPSVGTQINLARCSEHEGKIATAWGQLADAARRNHDAPASSRKAQVDAYISKMSQELSARVPHVRFIVVGAPNDELRLERDGATLPASALGQLLPFDPGDHVFTVRALGYRSVERRFSVAEAHEIDVSVKLVKEGLEELPPIALTHEGASTQSVAGFTLMGVGGASMIAGAILGGLSGAQAAEIPAGCAQDPFTCPSDSDTILANDASSMGSTFLTTSAITLAVGAALFGTGIILWATDGDPSPSTAFVPWIEPSSAGGGVRVQW